MAMQLKLLHEYSIVATTLKIALHKWINHRVCHDRITGPVASCAVCRAYIAHAAQINSLYMYMYS